MPNTKYVLKIYNTNILNNNIEKFLIVMFLKILK